MKIPSLKQAREMLMLAQERNPGPWVAHSICAAENARRIAEKCADMDAECAYVLGLLHDIGRGEWKHDLLHSIHGYEFLMAQGYEDAAKICLTHSFPISDIEIFFGRHDCNGEQLAFLQEFLETVILDDYDRLIQLCDAISSADGAVIIEKRLVDVAMRHGFTERMFEKWQAFFDLKRLFDNKTGCNIYTLLPDLEKNTIL